MRIGPLRSALAFLALGATFSLGLPESGATPGPGRALGSLSTVVNQRVSGPDARPAASLDEAVVRIDVTSKELRFAEADRDRILQDLQLATDATDELRGEVNDVGQDTLRYAIRGFRDRELRRSVIGADDLTSQIRAETLGAAAVSANTEAFDAYRNLRKDLEIEEALLIDTEDRASEASEVVTGLQDRLGDELAVYSRLEERQLADASAATMVQATNRALARGRKQGFYLDTCPVDGPHTFIDSWGFARSGGRRHKGVDILAEIGVPLVAPVSGRVEHFSNSVGGRSYRLYGNQGNYFYGTHLSAFGKEGEVVAGEVIGYVGDDGNARGIPHLHFEIHPGGRGNPIPPYVDTAAVCSGAR